MSTFTDALTRKIGPAPAWVYGVGLGLGITGVRYYRSKNAPAVASATSDDGTSAGTAAGATTPGAADDPGAYTTGTVGAYTLPGGYQATTSGVLDYTGQADAQTTQTPTTNAAWQQEAYDVLVGRLGYAPVTTEEALRAYLAGDPVSSSQEAVISQALRLVGRPPEGAPAITRSTTAPTVAAPTTPASTQTTPIATPAPAVTFTRPSWLTPSVKFVKGSGPATYLVTDAGLEWVPTEAAFIALGGGGTLRDADGRGNSYTWAANPNGTPPLVIPDSVLARLPRVGTLPDAAADPSLALR